MKINKPILLTSSALLALSLLGASKTQTVSASQNTITVTVLPDYTNVTVINDGMYNNIDGFDWARIVLSDGRHAFIPSRYLARN